MELSGVGAFEACSLGILQTVASFIQLEEQLWLKNKPHVSDWKEGSLKDEHEGVKIPFRYLCWP